MTRSRLKIALLAIAVIYSIGHFVMSGVVFALRTPNVGQVVEELQPLYSKGYYVRVLPGMQQIACVLGTAFEMFGALWVAVTLLRRSRVSEPTRGYWDWALIGLMMLVLAPQINQDYMVLTLGAFSFVLAACILSGNRAAWIEFAIAVLLVGNVVPRGLFSRFVGIDPIMAYTGYEHLIRSEAYQYFGFPLLGLLALARVWVRLSRIDDERMRHAPAAAV